MNLCLFFSVQEENLHDCLDEKVVGRNIVDAFDIISNVSKFYFHNEVVVPKFNEGLPVYDEYLDDSEQHFISFSSERFGQQESCQEKISVEVVKGNGSSSRFFLFSNTREVSSYLCIDWNVQDKINILSRFSISLNVQVEELPPSNILGKEKGMQVQCNHSNQYVSFINNQLEVLHEYKDPIATWMESSISNISNVAKSSMLPICNYEYKFLTKILLQMSYYSCTFLYSYKQKFHFISPLLAWIYWKFVYI
jgi:hypothetical protein